MTGGGTAPSLPALQQAAPGGYAGASPNAKLVSLDVIDDSGMGLTSDVIAAADWILRNKARYNIRVANFSLAGSTPSSFRFDPLDKAVERLWFSGVVVVAAAGNYGDHEAGVLFAPGNDPFVITVGADDVAGTVPVGDDFAAPWSSYGSTLDGFLKPEVSAPGRMLIGAVPVKSTLAQERPDRIVEPGYVAMSGTSFSTAIVSGVAADILAMNPRWTPDQVKGALMRTARPLSLGPQFAGGHRRGLGVRGSSRDQSPEPERRSEQVPDSQSQRRHDSCLRRSDLDNGRTGESRVERGDLDDGHVDDGDVDDRGLVGGHLDDGDVDDGDLDDRNLDDGNLDDRDLDDLVRRRLRDRRRR